MKAPTEQQAVGEVHQALADLLSIKEGMLRMRSTSDPALDFVISTKKLTFLGEYRASSSVGSLSSAVSQLAQFNEAADSEKIPLLVVPYMGKVGQELCLQAGISWLDLSGNARIKGPDLNIWIEGRPNKYVRRGRPANLFAPRSSRITRQLLLHPSRFQSQADIVRATGLDDGYVSKIVRRLRDDQLVVEDELNGIRPRNPSVLLNAWRDAYDFDRHRIIKGHVEARSGDALLRHVTDKLAEHDLEYAVTGLGAAWLLTHFASFRLTTFFVRSIPSRDFLSDIGFWEEEKGANLWFAIPNDEGVFQDSEVLEEIKCVSPLQAYLDLKSQPERSQEAAEELFKRQLTWKSGD